ncbi:MAG TPA: hypothetical protein VEF33_07410 [Syntrophales bacterium]|nr:hypothetical protein [Syntrophales bacterium]
MAIRSILFDPHLEVIKTPNREIKVAILAVEPVGDIAVLGPLD